MFSTQLFFGTEIFISYFLWFLRLKQSHNLSDIKLSSSLLPLIPVLRSFRGSHGLARLHHEPCFTVSVWFVAQGYLALMICFHELTCWLRLKRYVTCIRSTSQVEAMSTSCRRCFLEDKKKIRIVNTIFTRWFLKLKCATLTCRHMNWPSKWCGSKPALPSSLSRS